MGPDQGRGADRLNMTNIRVDFASHDDLDAMADLLTELFTLESDFRPDRTKQLRGLRLILDNPQMGRLFVLRLDGRVAGMANALINVSTAEGGPVVLLEDVIVQANCRGQGYGRMLVNRVCAWVVEAGMSRITLLADKDNEAALRFYAHMAFKPSAMTVLRYKVD
jgi:GNAT superfamily N-acetyltransferase